MHEATANPFLVSLICAARCLVPLAIMLGVSYLLKRFGLIAESPKPPAESNNGNHNNDNGGLAHGKA
ncbi:MAG: hypothetical protein AB1894_10985 [Chloroflexota bacterium]